MLIGVDQKPTIWSFYSKKPCLRSDIFPSTKPCEQFEAISKNLHFCDDTKISKYQGQKGLFKILSVVEHLNARFQSSYGLSQNISIDESLTMWKGRLGFKQYLPPKAANILRYVNPPRGVLSPSLYILVKEWSLITPTSHLNQIGPLQLFFPLFLTKDLPCELPISTTPLIYQNY